MLVKVMPPAVVYLNKLHYSGGLGPDEMRLKLSEWISNLTVNSFEKSDFVGVLYENGASYVDLEMDITVVRYATNYQAYTYDMADTDQRYTIPTNTLARFFSTPEEMPGVQRV